MPAGNPMGYNDPRQRAIATLMQAARSRGQGQGPKTFRPRPNPRPGMGLFPAPGTAPKRPSPVPGKFGGVGFTPGPTPIGRGQFPRRPPSEGKLTGRENALTRGQGNKFGLRRQFGENVGKFAGGSKSRRGGPDRDLLLRVLRKVLANRKRKGLASQQRPSTSRGTAPGTPRGAAMSEAFKNWSSATPPI